MDRNISDKLREALGCLVLHRDSEHHFRVQHYLISTLKVKEPDSALIVSNMSCAAAKWSSFCSPTEAWGQILQRLRGWYCFKKDKFRVDTCNTEEEERRIQRTAASEIRAAVGIAVTQQTVRKRLLQRQLRARRYVACFQ
ncbi:hypothetical protein TNCV_4750171 [Trichonephila clavipes]|nr:hypothetical protein TNCV_4750171 [Trichonephila clavipes]